MTRIHIFRPIQIVLLGALLAVAAFAQYESSKSTTKDEDKVSTPFGSVKKDHEAKPAPSRSIDPNLEVEANGDKITFIRKTPFGSQRWTKARSELSDAEQALVDKKLKPKTAAAESAKPSADKAAR